MGLAYSFQPNYSKAKDFFSKALDVIKLKTDKLEARLAESDSKSKGKGKATADNPCVVDRTELKELQNLYPEIKARVSDPTSDTVLTGGASQRKGPQHSINVTLLFSANTWPCFLFHPTLCSCVEHALPHGVLTFINGPG